MQTPNQCSFKGTCQVKQQTCAKLCEYESGRQTASLWAEDGTRKGRGIQKRILIKCKPQKSQLLI